MQQQNSIEKIKAYHGIKSFLNIEQREEIAKILGLSALDMEKRVWGKDNEVEFILMIHLLGWCKSIVGFEEGVAKLTDTVTSDLYIELFNGKKIVVEIKSTEDSKYKISEKQFNEKVNFAKSLNAELYFAIKLFGYWTLYDSEYLKNQGRKISIDNDYLKSQLASIFGERTFVFPKGLKITSIYSNKSEQHMGAQTECGYLVKYKMEYNNRKILAIYNKDDNRYPLTFLFEHLQEGMAQQKQDVIKLDSTRTVIVEELTNDMTIMNLSSFILSPIRHIMNELGNVYEFHQYLISLIDKRKSLLTKEHILMAINFLAENDYPVLEKRDNNSLCLFKDIIKNK